MKPTTFLTCCTVAFAAALPSGSDGDAEWAVSNFSIVTYPNPRGAITNYSFNITTSKETIQCINSSQGSPQPLGYTKGVECGPTFQYSFTPNGAWEAAYTGSTLEIVDLAGKLKATHSVPLSELTRLPFKIHGDRPYAYNGPTDFKVQTKLYHKA
ncbi:hypothetical protein TruAng_005282 [Truncatella angustata]|nr:hypothetical protein TruAng_005282 [Truncatella angustata]